MRRECDEMTKKTQTEENGKQTEMEMTDTRVVGEVRKSNAGGAPNTAINTSAFQDCSTYETSDGQTYVPLVISMNAVRRVIDGERAVTTVSQLQDN